MALPRLPPEIILQIVKDLPVDDVYTLRRMSLPPTLQAFQDDSMLEAAMMVEERWQDYNSVRPNLSLASTRELHNREATFWQHEKAYPCKKIGGAKSHKRVSISSPCGSMFVYVQEPNLNLEERFGPCECIVHDLVKNQAHVFTTENSFLPRFVLTQTLVAFTDHPPNMLFIQRLSDLQAVNDLDRCRETAIKHTLRHGIYVETMSGYHDRLVVLLGYAKNYFISLHDLSSDSLREEPFKLPDGGHRLVAEADSFTIFSNGGKVGNSVLAMSRYDYNLVLLERWRIPLKLQYHCQSAMYVRPTGYQHVVQMEFCLFDSDEAIYVVLNTKDKLVLSQRTGKSQVVWKDLVYRVDRDKIRVSRSGRMIGTLHSPHKVMDLSIDDSFLIVGHKEDRGSGWTAFTFDESIDTGLGGLSTVPQADGFYWQSAPATRARTRSGRVLG